MCGWLTVRRRKDSEPTGTGRVEAAALCSKYIYVRASINIGAPLNMKVAVVVYRKEANFCCRDRQFIRKKYA